MFESSWDLRVSVLQRRARLCRRLANGAVPLSVMQQLAALAMDYERKAVRLNEKLSHRGQTTSSSTQPPPTSISNPASVSA
jgi:hypothetical protein